MSIEAMVWALQDAPDVPPSLVTTLLGLANHADPDGCSAYPTVDRLAHYTRKGARQVKDDLRRLRDLKLITEGDQRLISHLDPRYRPTVYNLAMHRRRSRYVKNATIVEQDPVPITPSRDEPKLPPAENLLPGATGTNSSAPTGRGRRKPSNTRDPLADTADQVRRYQPRWKKASVIAALEQAIAEGLDPTVACTVMIQLAQGTPYGQTTAGPQRILARGPWWIPGEVFVPKSKDNAKPCPHHPGQPAHNCAGCAGENRGADGPAHPSDWNTIPPAPPESVIDQLARFGWRSKRVPN